jgi:hypothetical protein
MGLDARLEESGVSGLRRAGEYPRLHEDLGRRLTGR